MSIMLGSLPLDYDKKTRYVELKFAIPKGLRKLVEVLVEKSR